MGTLSSDEVRAKLESAVKAISVPAQELAKAKASRTRLDDISGEINAQGDALQRTSELILELIPTIPVYFISLQLTSEYGSFTDSFIPHNSEMKDLIVDKKAELDRDISKDK